MLRWIGPASHQRGLTGAGFRNWLGHGFIALHKGVLTQPPINQSFMDVQLGDEVQDTRAAAASTVAE